MPTLSINREKTVQNIEKTVKKSQKYRKTVRIDKKQGINRQKYRKKVKNKE